MLDNTIPIILQNIGMIVGFLGILAIVIEAEMNERGK